MRLHPQPRLGALALVNWIRGQQTTQNVITGFGLKPSADGGYSLFAGTPLAPNTNIITLTTAQTIRFDQWPINITPAPYDLQRLVDALNFNFPQLTLALRILSERRRRTAPSYYAAYIHMLPQSFPTIPIFYPVTVVKALQYAPLQHQIALRVNALSETAAAIRNDPTLIAHDSFAGAVDVNDLAWALSSVTSRAFTQRNRISGDTICRSLPLIDMANHSFTPNCRVEYDDAGGTLSLITVTSIQRGDDLTISYGTHSNDDLLLNYGFIMDENPFDKIHIKWSASYMKSIVESDGTHVPELTAWQYALTEHNIPTDLTIGKVIDERFIAMLRVLLADVQNVPSAAQSALSDAYWHTADLHRAVEETIRNTLHSYLLELLAAFPTGIDDDISALKKSVQTSTTSAFTPNELAIRFRLAKKRLLTHHIHMLQVARGAR